MTISTAFKYDCQRGIALNHLDRFFALIKMSGRIVVFSIPLIFATILIILSFSPSADLVWRTQSIDISVVVLIVLISIFIFIISNENIRARVFHNVDYGEMAGMGAVVIAAFAVFITYGTFRNQASQTAESNLNQEAMQLFGFEMDKDNQFIRCLYDNYGHNDPNQCLSNIISSDEKWSRTMLYVEESWFILTKGLEDRHRWGSRYFDDLQYWREDIEKDPTGLFSYQLVSTEGSKAQADIAMIKAGVKIPNLCKGYNNVWDALREAGKAPADNLCR